jgi:hypothetical protein
MWLVMADFATFYFLQAKAYVELHVAYIQHWMDDGGIVDHLVK